jgi:hypothetical protein
LDVKIPVVIFEASKLGTTALLKIPVVSREASIVTELEVLKIVTLDSVPVESMRVMPFVWRLDPTLTFVTDRVLLEPMDRNAGLAMRVDLAAGSTGLVVMTLLPVPDSATAAKSESSGAQQTEFQALFTADVRDVHVMPLGLVITLLPVPVTATAAKR